MEIVLSATEAEYIALIRDMCNVIPFMALINCYKTHPVGGLCYTTQKYTRHLTFTSLQVFSASIYLSTSSLSLLYPDCLSPLGFLLMSVLIKYQTFEVVPFQTLSKNPLNHRMYLYQEIVLYHCHKRHTQADESHHIRITSIPIISDNQ